MIRTYHTLQQTASFCSKLQRLLESGVPLLSALNSLKQDEKKPWFKARIENLLAHLQDGKSFTSGLRFLLPEEIPFGLGDVTHIGDLSLFLEQLSAYYTQKTTYVTELVKKMVYPGFLLMSLVSLLALLGGFLLPTYANFYANMNLSLPLGIRLMHNGFYLIGSLWSGYSVIVIGIAVLLGFSKIWPIWKRWIWRLFFPENIGDILWRLSILLSAGIPLKQALANLQLPAQHLYQKPLQKFQAQVLQSGDFTSSFTAYFPLSNYQKELMHHAQKSGKFAVLLQEIALSYHQAEQQHFQKYLSLAQPLLLATMGILLLGCVYMMFIPVISTLQQVL